MIEIKQFTGSIPPKDFFLNSFVNNRFENIFDIRNIIEDDEPHSDLWKQFWALLDSMPTGIEFDKIPKGYDSIYNLLELTKTKNTMGSLLEDMMKLFENPEKYEKTFKTIRNQSNQDLKLKTDNSQWGDPFIYLDEILKKNKTEKSFLDIANDTLTNSGKELSRYDYFTSYYIQLDMFGFHKDKKMANLIDDSSHSFYGAHSDIFVTDDGNTFEKSKALYKKLNINTKVLKSADFISSTLDFQFKDKNLGVIEQINYSVKNSTPILTTTNEDSNKIDVFSLKPLLLDFFNRMQISYYKEHKTLVFYKKEDNYSNFIFWEELRIVVNKFIKEFGNDINNQSEFLEVEKEQISSNEWKGRFWKFETFNIGMNYLEDGFGLCFKIDFPS